MSTIEPKWWTPEEFAKQTGITTDQASRLRIAGEGPPFVKLGRAVRYLNLDVLRWHQDNRTVKTNG